MESRQIYAHRADARPVPISEENEKYHIAMAAPILSEGDVLGCVMFAEGENGVPMGEMESKLIQTIAGFLGKHMES
jgi:AbrB family transcriptional regulator (stage V sporulation protein T)